MTVPNLNQNSGTLVDVSWLAMPSIQPVFISAKVQTRLGEFSIPQGVPKEESRADTKNSEDCYYLTKEIPAFDATKGLSTSLLKGAFKAYATKQQPHTSTLVKGARAVGMARVAAPELCSQRDQAITQSMADREGLRAKFDLTYSRPFKVGSSV